MIIHSLLGEIWCGRPECFLWPCCNKHVVLKSPYLVWKVPCWRPGRMSHRNTATSQKRPLFTWMGCLYPWICLLLTTLTLWYPAGIRGKKMHSCESFTIQLKSPRLQAFTNTTYHFCCGQNKCLQGKKKSALLAPLPPTDLWRGGGVRDQLLGGVCGLWWQLAWGSVIYPEQQIEQQLFWF